MLNHGKNEYQSYSLQMIKFCSQRRYICKICSNKLIIFLGEIKEVISFIHKNMNKLKAFSWSEKLNYFECVLFFKSLNIKSNGTKINYNWICYQKIKFGMMSIRERYNIIIYIFLKRKKILLEWYKELWL